MDCFYPVTIGSNLFPCGHCVACLARRQSDWTIRLSEEYKSSTSCLFVTLTYNDESIPKAILSDFAHRSQAELLTRLGVDINPQECNVLSRTDIQKYMKRLRKAVEPHRFRFFLCGEYGPTTLRPHYHMILFNFPLDKVDLIKSKWSHPKSKASYGFTVIDTVTPARIAYVAKYSSSSMSLPKRLRFSKYKPFILCSRNPAIGSNYLTDKILHYHRTTLDTTILQNGYKKAMPKYYKDRIFDDAMKFTIRERVQVYRDKKAHEFFLRYGDRDYRADLVKDALRRFNNGFKKRML